MSNTPAPGGDVWPRASAPTYVDTLLADIAAISGAHPSALSPTDSSRGLFQTIPGTWKGAPTMDASQQHHSDILDTLSDYLTRPEVHTIQLDYDSGTDTWAITATVDVDPEHEARKLEADMAEAVQMTTGGTIHADRTPPPVAVPKSPKVDEPAGSADLRRDVNWEPLGVVKTPPEVDTAATDTDAKDTDAIVETMAHIPKPHLGNAEMVLEVVDCEGDTWRRTWGNRWGVVSNFTGETVTEGQGRSWADLMADYGPLAYTVTACQVCIDTAREARHEA